MLALNNATTAVAKGFCVTGFQGSEIFCASKPVCFLLLKAQVAQCTADSLNLCPEARAFRQHRDMRNHL